MGYNIAVVGEGAIGWIEPSSSLKLAGYTNVTTGVNSAYRTGNTTRGKRKGVKYIIKVF